VARSTSAVEPRSSVTGAPADGVGQPAVALGGVSVVRDGRRLLDDVTWQVRKGERWAVLGPNGSGKTTLLSVAAMRLLPTTGQVTVLGNRYGHCDARAVRRRVALVSGSVARQLRPALCAHDIVVTGRTGALEPFWQESSDADHAEADTLLAAAGLTDAADRPFGVLSEGERQQVLVARALMSRPELLLFDEPAAGLDLGARERLVRRLAELAADPAAPPQVLVTHHVEEIPPGVTHAALVRQGRLVAAGSAEEVLSGPAVSACFGVAVVVERRDGRWRATAAS
jgi:iron complex transport system ATP-binding protein